PWPRVAFSEPTGEPISPGRVGTGDDPAASLFQMPDVVLPFPLFVVRGIQGNHFYHFPAGAASPLDERIAGIDNDIDVHATSSAPSARSSLATSLTSFANPCPVTAEIDHTSRPSSFSRRARISSLPVSSHLLTARISGFFMSA